MKVGHIYYSKLLRRHIDLSHIQSISDPRLKDYITSGGWYVSFEIKFALTDKANEFIFEVVDSSEIAFMVPNPSSLPTRHLAVLTPAGTTRWIAANELHTIAPNDVTVAERNLRSKMSELIDAWIQYRSQE